MRGHALLATIVIILLVNQSSAGITNINVTSLTNRSYSDIWLGVSTGGYDLIAKKGESYEFRVFIKNGMSDRSLHNVELTPANITPLQLISITPKSIDQLKPMEIRIYYVNVSVPKEALSAKHPVKFYLASDEFPVGIFFLDTEIKLVDRIKTELYIIYTALILLILAWFFYRKWKQDKK